MNKVPAKQIYLLSIIIVGIIALSVYSTYALFTFESSTTDIVSIHTPKSLTISENVYEYQQIVIEPNTITTTNIDIYNSFDYEICYSVWYKIIGDNDIRSKIQIFEQTNENLKTSGVIAPTTNVNITIVVINDNDSQVKINLGTIGASQKEGSCSLNLDDDKEIIDSSYENIAILTTTLLEEKDNPTQVDANYLTYKDITDTMTFKNTDSIYVSNEFTYDNELFTLTEGEKLTLQEYVNKYNLAISDKYFCLNNKQCNILYKITNLEKVKNSDDDKDDIYNLTKYDKLIGYSKGTNGLRLVNDKDYVYYGDNPNNFIYYNCENSDNLDTCELWRIVGFFYDEKTKSYNTKIVRNDSIGKYQFDYKMVDNINESTNNWNDSTLNKYLNEEYKLKNDYNIYIEKYTQLLERIPNLETDVKNMKVKEENISSNINLLNLSDYLYTSVCDKNKINEYTGECLTNNWLNNIEISSEWTLSSKEVEEPILPNEDTETETENNNAPTDENQTETPNEDTENTTDESLETESSVEENNYVINYIYTIGKNISEVDVNESLDVRPVVYLKSRMILLDGNGSLSSPYVVK